MAHDEERVVVSLGSLPKRYLERAKTRAWKTYLDLGPVSGPLVLLAVSLFRSVGGVS